MPRACAKSEIVKTRVIASNLVFKENSFRVSRCPWYGTRGETPAALFVSNERNNIAAMFPHFDSKLRDGTIPSLRIRLSLIVISTREATSFRE